MDNAKTYLAIFIPILIFLLFLLYRNLYGTVNERALKSFNYRDKITLQNLPSCTTRTKTKEFSYRLADYYISASYMTPCARNLHYDYVSLDIIKEVLASGARFIQIPICSDSVDSGAFPVVATSENRVITSLNTLSVPDVLMVIREYGFIYKQKHINYPLIVQFVLYTRNIFTLNNLADNIKLLWNGLTLDNKPFAKDNTKFIWNMPLCQLQNRIIVLTNNDNYQNTDMTDIVIPRDTFTQQLHYTEITSQNILTEQEQLKEYNEFKRKYPTIESLLTSINYNGAEILKADHNALPVFNKVGASIISPVRVNDSLANNFNWSDSMQNGCQINLMCFQTNDTAMKSYIDFFKNGSFVLKPPQLRFDETKSKETDIMMLVELDRKPIRDFSFIGDISKLYNKVISLRSDTINGGYLSVYNNKLQIGQLSGDKLGAHQLFQIKKSRVFLDYPTINLVPLDDQTQVITLNKNKFGLELISKDNKKARDQSLILTMPLGAAKIQTISDDELPFNIGNWDGSQYLGTTMRNIRAYNYDTNMSDIGQNLLFYGKSIPYINQISLSTSDFSNLHIYKDGHLGLTSSSPATWWTVKYITAKGDSGGGLFNQKIVLIDSTNKYWTIDDDGYIRSSKLAKTYGLNNVITIIKFGEFVKIQDIRNRILKKNKEGTLIRFEKSLENEQDEYLTYFKMTNKIVLDI